MPRGFHGKDGKYIHIRLRDPKNFSRMRTVDMGDGIKQVMGKVKNKQQWQPQNVMVPVKKIDKKNGQLSVKSKKLRNHLKHLGVSLSKVKRMKTRGENDYKHPAPPCPSSRIRSKGRGQGKGFGKGKGPIGRMKKGGR